MKKIAVLMMLGLLTGAGEVRNLLEDFRNNVSLAAGGGYGKTPEQVMISGTATHLEMTAAFQEILRQNGIESEIRTGRIALNSVQTTDWIPFDFAVWKKMQDGGHTAGDAGSYECDFSWLRLEVPAVPDFGSRGGDFSAGAVTHIDVFPGLNGIEQGEEFQVPEGCGNLPLMLNQHLKQNFVWNAETEDNSILEEFPAGYTAEQAENVVSAWGKENGTEHKKWHDKGIPGYLNRRTLSPAPVKVISVAENSGIPETMRAEVCVRIYDESGDILTCSMPQEQLQGKALSLFWNWDDTGEEPAVGDVVLNRKLNGTLYCGDELLGSGKRSISAGRKLTIEISRQVPAFRQPTDYISNIVYSGSSCAVSCLPLGISDEEATLENMALIGSELRKRAMSAVYGENGYICPGQFQGCIVSREPVYEYLDGGAYSIKKFNEVISLPPESVSPLKNTKCRATDNAIAELQGLVGTLAFVQKSLDGILSGKGNSFISAYCAVAGEPGKIHYSSAEKMPDVLDKGNFAGFLQEDREYGIYYLEDAGGTFALVKDLTSSEYFTLITDDGVIWHKNAIMTEESGSGICLRLGEAGLLRPLSWLLAETAEPGGIPETDMDAAVVYIMGYNILGMAELPEIKDFISDKSIYGKGDETALFSFSLENTDGWEIEISKGDAVLDKAFGTPEDGTFVWNFEEQDEGSYEITLTAENGKFTERKAITVKRDLRPPVVKFHAGVLEEAGGLSAEIRYTVDDDSPVTTCIDLLDAGGICLESVRCGNKEGKVILNVPDEGEYAVVLTCCDGGGNTTVETEQIRAARNGNFQPELLVEIQGLNERKRVLCQPFTARAAGVNLSRRTRIYLYLDEQLLAEREGNSVIARVDPFDWEEGSYTLYAVAEDEAGGRIISNQLVFYYSRYAQDNFAPEIEVAAEQWPINGNALLCADIRDEGGLNRAIVSCGEDVICFREASVGSNTLRINNIPCSPESLATGIKVEAWDEAGNCASRILKISEPEPGSSQELYLESPCFGGDEVHGELPVYSYCSGATPAMLQLYLNGSIYQTVYFPETEVYVYQIPEDDLLDGKNVIYGKAFYWNNVEAESPEYQVRTPVIRRPQIEPPVIRPWAGTESILKVTAVMKYAHDWKISLAGMGVNRTIEGNGTEISGEFDTVDLPDGEYNIQILVEELGASCETSVEVDAVRGIPVAEIEYPGEWETVAKGVLRVAGTVRNSEDEEAVEYYLELFDENGGRLRLISAGGDGMRLTAVPYFSGQEEIEPVKRSGMVKNGLLGALDLSALSNGRYELRMIVYHDEQYKRDSVPFELNSELKTGHFAYSEVDFTAFAGNIPVKVSRSYSTQNLDDSGIGCGWSHAANYMKPVIDESRTVREGVDGEWVSVRSGGSRDITLTLSNGRRVTFVFSLVPGGGWSFCYYASWRAPAGVNADLRPVCSDKLMTLTGLEPYWEAAGPSTPWEVFDFPGFILTESDGTVYHIGRQELGTIDTINDYGEYEYIQAYGDLYVKELDTGEGSRLLFENDSIAGVKADGSPDVVLRFQRDELTGKIISAETLKGEKDKYLYSYDGIGNLVCVSRCMNDETTEVYRQYDYELAAYPHHLTGVRRGDGTLLLNVLYDSAGRLIGTSGGDGATETARRDVFAGFEVRQDPMGRETLYTFNDDGKVLSKTGPGGGKTSYAYDGMNRETEVTDPLGGKISREYDSSGYLASVTNALGEKTSYQYSGGKCTSISDALGRTWNYSYDSSGRVSSFMSHTGERIENGRDKAGRLTSISFPASGEKTEMAYNNKGLLTSISGSSGAGYNFEYDEEGRNTYKEARYFHPVTGEETVIGVTMDYDNAGNMVYLASSEGGWKRAEYDSNGNATVLTDSAGGAVYMKYNMSGKPVETLGNNGFLNRKGYNLGGQLLFEASTDAVEDWSNAPAVCEFERAKLYKYNVAGLLQGVSVVRNAKIKLYSTGTDSWDCVMQSFETEEAGEERYYDLKGQLTRQISAEGFESRTTYNKGGYVTAREDHFKRKTEMEYGTGGLLKRVVNPDGGVITSTYDSRGMQDSITGPAGGVVRFARDKDGEVCGVTDPQGNFTSYLRSSDGLLEGVVLPGSGGGIKYSYGYDSVGALRYAVNPRGGRTEYMNDEYGRRVSSRLPMGQQSRTVFSGSEIYPAEYTDFNGNTVTYSYSQTGQLTGRMIFDGGENPRKTYSYRRMSGGQVLESRVSCEDGVVHETTYSYDDDGRMTGKNLDGKEVLLEYDRDSRLKGVDTGTHSVRIDYRKDEPEVNVSVSLPGGLSEGEEYTGVYDYAGRVTSLTRPGGGQRLLEFDKAGAVKSIVEKDGNGRELFRIEYTRDLSSRAVSALESWDKGGIKEEKHTEWGYDVLGRLAWESCSSGSETFMRSYEYDDAGNRIGVTENSDGEKTEFEYDLNDRLTAVRRADGSTIALLKWDDNGSLLSIDEGGKGKTMFSWDAEGFLEGVQKKQGENEYAMEFEYDPQGLLCRDVRIETSGGAVRKESRQYIYAELSDGAAPVLLEAYGYDEDGIQLWSRGYFSAGNGVSAIYGDGVRKNCITDGSGTLRGVFEDGGTVSRLDYDSFGIPAGECGVDVGIGFNGEWQDFETGLVYMRTRFYLPKFGIFVSADRAEGARENPQSLNRYVFCQNDPVNRVDPYGTMSLLTISLATFIPKAILAKTGSLIDLALKQSMTFDFSNMDKEQDNVTVVVHGVGEHLPNYSSSFMDRLRAGAGNQDYMEFLWSGFSISSIPLLPNYLQHRIALGSLKNALGILKTKGHRNINLVSHSWGTILTKDVLKSGVTDVGLWVTMGSPLPNDIFIKEAVTLVAHGVMDFFGMSYHLPYTNWLNIYTLADPVVHLCISSPDIASLNLQWAPLYLSLIPDQVALKPKFSLNPLKVLDPHGIYWTDDISILAITRILKAQ